METREAERKKKTDTQTDKRTCSEINKSRETDRDASILFTQTHQTSQSALGKKELGQQNRE